jgi:hypothetical protein
MLFEDRRIDNKSSEDVSMVEETGSRRRPITPSSWTLSTSLVFGMLEHPLETAQTHTLPRTHCLLGYNNAVWNL